MSSLRVVEAAAELVDRDGLDALTLAAVADAVGRHVSSLYNHVDGVDGLRKELVLLTLDQLGDALWRAALGRSGRDAVVSLMLAYRQFIKDHQERWKLVMRQDPTEPGIRDAASRATEALEAVMLSFGVPSDRAVHAHRIFSTALIGLATRYEAYRIEGAPIDDTYDMLAEFVVAALGAERARMANA
jgi:AcrR family transcriptional regulator